eukprot:SAG31_NODE_8344_length_1469_cov_4.342336_3_plen_131_part_00
MPLGFLVVSAVQSAGGGRGRGRLSGCAHHTKWGRGAHWRLRRLGCGSGVALGSAHRTAGETGLPRLLEPLWSGPDGGAGRRPGVREQLEPSGRSVDHRLGPGRSPPSYPGAPNVTDKSITKGLTAGHRHN